MRISSANNPAMHEEDEAGDEVLDPDDLVIERKDVLAGRILAARGWMWSAIPPACAYCLLLPSFLRLSLLQRV